MKEHKKALVLLAAGAFIVMLFVLGALFVSSRNTIYTTYTPFGGRLFNIMAADIDEISIQSGVSGESVNYTEAGDIAELVDLLNRSRYRFWLPTIPIAKGGWSYRIILREDDHLTSFVFGENWIKFNGIIYQYNADVIQNLISRIPE